MPRPVRFLLFAGFALAVALTVVAFSLGDSATPKPCREPDPIEATTPTCNAPSVAQQQPMIVDLAPGFDAEIVADLSTSGAAIPLPRDEMTIQGGSGQMLFQPGPGKAVTAWAPTTCIQVNYFEILDPNNRGSYRFCFGAA